MKTQKRQSAVSVAQLEGMHNDKDGDESSRSDQSQRHNEVRKRVKVDASTARVTAVSKQL